MEHKSISGTQEDTILARNRELSSLELLVELVHGLPDFVGIMNEYRRFILVNSYFFANETPSAEKDFIGLRPGEVFGCVHASEGPDGCGSGPACSVCNVVKPVLAALRTKEIQEQDAHLLVKKKGRPVQMFFHVTAKPIMLENELHIMLFLKDIQEEMRKRQLERIFMHDLTNTTSSMKALLVHYMENKEVESFIDDIVHISGDIVDQIDYFKVLSQVENNQYRPLHSEVDLASTVKQVINMLLHTFEKKRVFDFTVPHHPIILETDYTILKRILINMVKNACEAAGYMGKIKLWTELHADETVIAVQNNQVIPPEIQRQIFYPDISTKGVNRGVGTYSMKLLATSVLGGDVSFLSSEETGTVFRLSLPR